MRKLALLAALFASACGSTTSVTLCNGTVMGKLTGTFSTCNEFDQRYRANLNTWALNAAYTELPTAFTLSTEWEIKGEPRTTSPMRKYDQDTADLKCNVTMKKGAPTWVARTGAGVPTS